MNRIYRIWPRSAGHRMVQIEPFIGMTAEIGLDFSGVRHGNGSFVNGLLTGLIEEHGETLLDRLTFRGCNPILRDLVKGAIALGVEKHDRRAKA